MFISTTRNWTWSRWDSLAITRHGYSRYRHLSFCSYTCLDCINSIITVSKGDKPCIRYRNFFTTFRALHIVSTWEDSCIFALEVSKDLSFLSWTQRCRVVDCNSIATYRFITLVKTFNSKIGSGCISLTITICNCICKRIGSWFFRLPSSTLTSNCSFYINIEGGLISCSISSTVISPQIPWSSCSSSGIIRRT